MKFFSKQIPFFEKCNLAAISPRYFMTYLQQTITFVLTFIIVEQLVLDTYFIQRRSCNFVAKIEIKKKKSINNGE